jgi:transposase-like protein
MAAPKKYPDELKARVVRLVMDAEGKDRGATRRIARQLSINYEMLRRWVRQAKVDGGEMFGLRADPMRSLRTRQVFSPASSARSGADEPLRRIERDGSGRRVRELSAIGGCWNRSSVSTTPTATASTVRARCGWPFVVRASPSHDAR